MCGILGIVAPPGHSVRIDENRMIRMRDTMTSRGPDGSGLFQKRNVAFAHRRLAIRDLQGGQQPWISDDGSCALVYNGEIYNDAELRQQLTAAGHRFRSRCDTEVVFAAYRQWGTDCLQKLRGMFALGIYDFNQERLFLARDRFGIKPLYFANIDQELIFASDPAALLEHPRFSKLPNLRVISHYLTTFRVTLGRETMYAGLQQLLPGEFMVVENGKQRMERYWRLPAESADTVEYEKAAEELEALLQEAVQCRLASDVPVGAFLSGGVDSNTLVSMLTPEQSAGLIAFCGGGTGESEDFEYARHCADHFGCDHDNVKVDQQDYLEGWRDLLSTGRLPLSTPSDVIIYRLAQRLKQRVGVALGGEGADELLCGYAVQHWSPRDFIAAQQLQRGDLPGSPHAAALMRQSLLEQYGRSEFQSAADHYLALNSLIPTGVKPRLLQTWAWKLAERDEPLWEHYERLFAGTTADDPLRRQAEVIHQVNLESLLARLDRSTMAAGLEARVPYTDHLLVEWIFKLPMRYKIDIDPSESSTNLSSAALEARGGLRSKRLLRTVAARRLPAELAQRRKASFPTPVAAWLPGPWRDWARTTLSHSPFARNLFQAEPLRELAENPDAVGMWLWPLLNLTLWGDQEFTASASRSAA